MWTFRGKKAAASAMATPMQRASRVVGSGGPSLGHFCWPDHLSWRWKWHSQPVSEDHGLEVLRGVRMHHRTVAVSFHVLSKALDGMRPRHLTRLFILPTKGVKALHQCQGVLVCVQVHEAIAQIHSVAEIHRHVDEVVSALEAFLIHELEHLVLAERSRNVAQHHCRVAAVASSLDRGFRSTALRPTPHNVTGLSIRDWNLPLLSAPASTLDPLALSELLLGLLPRLMLLR